MNNRTEVKQLQWHKQRTWRCGPRSPCPRRARGGTCRNSTVRARPARDGDGEVGRHRALEVTLLRKFCGWLPEVTENQK